MNFDSPWFFGAVGIICLAIYMLARLGMKIKIDRDGASMTHNNDPIPPLIPEKYAREIISLVQRTAEYHAQISEIKHSTIRNQMRVYEELELSALSLMRSSFLEIAGNLKLDNTCIRKELSAFTTILGFIFSQTKDFIRTSFLNNHYYTMEEEEFLKYIQDKQRTVVEMVSRELDLLWVSDYVDRELIRTIKDDKSIQISELLSSLYKKAKRIAIENRDLVEKKSGEYNNYVVQMTGVDPSQC